MITGFFEWLRARATRRNEHAAWDKQFKRGAEGAFHRGRRKNPLRGIACPRIYANEDKGAKGTISVNRHV